MKVRPLHPDEVKLIEQSRSNNRRAQKQLYDKYAPKMLSVCRYYVKDIHHAEDLLMQGFFKAFTHLHQFGRTDNFEGYGGFNIQSSLKLKGPEIKEKVDPGLNFNDLIYGISGYVFLPKLFTLYGKVDLAPLFKDQTYLQQNISLGFRFDIN